MKRFFVIFLSLLVLVVTIPLPALASSFDPLMKDMGDLYDLQESDTRIYNSVNPVYNIEFNTDNKHVGYVEFMVFTNVNITSADVSGVPCDFVSSSDDSYRIWCCPTDVRSSISLNITGTTPNSYLYILSAQYSPNNRLIYDVNADIVINNGYQSELIYNGSSLNLSVYHDEVLENHVRNFYIGIIPNDIQLYDQLSLSLNLRVQSIVSVTVGFADTINVPYEVSYLDNPSFHDINPLFRLKIDIDLSDIDWHKTSGDLAIYITGDYWTGDYMSDVTSIGSLLGIHGFIIEDITNPIIFWFKKFFKRFADGEDSEQQAADEFVDDMDQMSQEIDQMNQVMDSVNKPAASDIQTDLNDTVSSSSVMLATQGLSHALSETYILKILIMAMTFALIGFVLYGKR